MLRRSDLASRLHQTRLVFAWRALLGGCSDGDAKAANGRLVCGGYLGRANVPRHVRVCLRDSRRFVGGRVHSILVRGGCDPEMVAAVDRG